MQVTEGQDTEMKDAVVIKSYQNGINLLLNSESSVDAIVAELSQKFTDSKSFFGKAKTAVSMEGKKLTDAEQLRIVDAIRKNSDLQIICLVGKDDSTGQNFTKALERMDRHFTPEHSAGRFYKGSLTDKQMLESEENIVILGDVNPGCTVISAQSIVVLGGLYGEAYAGLEGEGSYYIAALEMAPEKLKIGDFKYTAQKARWGIKPKVHPQVAYVKNNKVVLESLTKELLGTIS